MSINRTQKTTEYFQSFFCEERKFIMNVVTTKLLDEASATENRNLNPATRFTCYEFMIPYNCEKTLYKSRKKHKIS